MSWLQDVDDKFDKLKVSSESEIIRKWSEISLQEIFILFQKM